MVFKMLMPKILARFGYRNVLLSNTIFIGLIMALFSLIDQGTSIAIIVTLGTLFGFFSSLQYTSMNTLVFADVIEAETSMASTISSTMQQLSMSFGVATASLIAEVFIPETKQNMTLPIVTGLHHAFVFLGAVTILSAGIFRILKNTDGENISQHKVGTEH